MKWAKINGKTAKNESKVLEKPLSGQLQQLLKTFSNVPRQQSNNVFSVDYIATYLRYARFSLSKLENRLYNLLIWFGVTKYKNRDIFRSKSNIYDKTFWGKIVNGFSHLTIFAKTLHRRYLTGF